MSGHVIVMIAVLWALMASLWYGLGDHDYPRAAFWLAAAFINFTTVFMK